MLRKFKSVASVVLVLSLFLSSLPQITFASVASSTKELLSFSNEVNAAPVLEVIGNKTVNEGGQLTFTVTASDAEGDTLTYSLGNAPTGASINSTTGVFTWTPTEAQGPGSYTFSVHVSDGALTDEEEIIVTVNEINEAPVLGAIGNKTVDEETLLTFTATATDADLPANMLTYSLVGAPIGASINPITGVFTWTPTEAQGPGSYPFSVNVSDGVLTDEEQIIVTVNEVNAAPVLVVIGNKTVNEDSELAFTAKATDSDSAILTYSLVDAPTGASINATTGVFKWTPSEAQGPGVYRFVVRVSDGTLTDDETITVTVNEVNVAPVLVSIGNKSADEGTLLTFTATATDADLPANTLTYSLVGALTGASIDPATGVFTWTPTEAQGPGSYTINVRVTDGNLTDEEQITVTVNEVNVAPILDVIGNKTVNEETELTFTATATDADLPANTLIYSLVGAPTGASIDPATGVFTWTPTEAQGPGSYSFEVVVSDGALTDRKEITVTVTRAASSNVDLSGLTLSSGTVSPAFSPATTSYTASVGNGVTSIAVTPTTADAGATVKVNSATVTSGVTSGAIPLTIGVNPIIVEVTAQDSISTQTYTLTVTRARASGGDGGAQPAIPTEPEPGPAPAPEPSIEPPITENPEKNALDFVDVDMENWASEAIQSLVSKGIILGYPNNEFRPNEFIRREHMVVMISRLGLLTERREVAEFTDVPTQYVYYNEIRLAQLAGIIEGSDGEFWPKQPLTRAQAAKVIVLLFGLETESAKSFEDVPDKVWYAPYINTLASRGIVFGDGIYFKPNDNVTRAQFAAMLYRALQQIES